MSIWERRAPGDSRAELTNLFTAGHLEGTIGSQGELFVRSAIALAGLWENWRSAAGEWVRSFAIITTAPNELCAELHNRMPVVLGRENWPSWLGGEPADPRQLKAMLTPYPSEEMTCWPVSPRVGNVKNNDPSLIEPKRQVG